MEQRMSKRWALVEIVFNTKNNLFGNLGNNIRDYKLYIKPYDFIYNHDNNGETGPFNSSMH